jgi:shikimate dehydrogenase
LALARGGLGSLTVAVREPDRGRPVTEVLDGLDVAVRIVPLGDAAAVEADLVVNATPVGAAGEGLPLPRLGPDVIVVDLLYYPATTWLLSSARAAGATAFGGLGLLLEQAALAFELWTGQAAPLEVMSAAAVAALASTTGGGGHPDVV